MGEQKALDCEHQGPTHKTIKQLQSFHRPPTSALCKVCASQQSWNAKNSTVPAQKQDSAAPHNENKVDSFSLFFLLLFFGEGLDQNLKNPHEADIVNRWEMIVDRKEVQNFQNFFAFAPSSNQQ